MPKQATTDSSIGKSFSEQIDDVLAGKANRFNDLKVCDTPQILLDVGCEQLPMLYTQRHLRNAIKPINRKEHTHGLDIRTIKEMPTFLSEPAMIYDSLTRNDSLIVVTTGVDNLNQPIIASIKPNGKGQYEMKNVPSNFITSLYGRENFTHHLNDIIKNNKLLYINKEKSQALFSVLGLEFPKGLNNLDFNIIIHKSRNIVKPFARNSAGNTEKGVNKIMKDNKLTECRDDIVAAIKSGYDGSSVRNINVSDVIDKHGAEAVQTVLAATIQCYNWDGRFSRDNKEWASGFSLSAKQTDNIAITTAMSHPYITNGVTNMVRKELSEREKAAEKINESTNHFEIYGNSNDVFLFTFDKDGKANKGIEWEDSLQKDGDGKTYAGSVLDTINKAKAGTLGSRVGIDIDCINERAQLWLENITTPDPEMEIYYGKMEFLGDENGLNRAFEEKLKLLSTQENFVYKLDGDNAVITGYIGENKDVVIPSEIDGHTVTAIGASAFEDCTSLEAVVIPDSVSEIGSSAFKGCTSLESASIPRNLKDWENAFPKDTLVFSDAPDTDFEYKLDGDNAIIIGYIGENKDVVIPSEIDGHKVTAIAGSLDNTATGMGAFENNDTITSVVIPDGVTSIGDTAFLNCTALESVSIPDSVKEIKGAAFLYCDSLKNVELPKDAKVSSAAFDKGAVVKRPPAKEEKSKEIKSRTAEKPSKSLTADNRKKRKTDIGIGD